MSWYLARITGGISTEGFVSAAAGEQSWRGWSASRSEFVDQGLSPFLIEACWLQRAPSPSGTNSDLVGTTSPGTAPAVTRQLGIEKRTRITGALDLSTESA